MIRMGHLKMDFLIVLQEPKKRKNLNRKITNILLLYIKY
jgi:hypothetical protein